MAILRCWICREKETGQEHLHVTFFTDDEAKQIDNLFSSREGGKKTVAFGFVLDLYPFSHP